MANIEDIENTAIDINYLSSNGISNQSFTIRDCVGECCMEEEMKMNGELPVVFGNESEFNENVQNLRDLEAIGLRSDRIHRDGNRLE